jgi:plastocyanin
MRKSLARCLVVAFVLALTGLWPASMASAGGGCHGPQTRGTGDTVTLAEACFGPNVLEVDPGTAVTFVNKDPMTHNVSAVGWGSANDLEQGDSFTTRFEEEGTFPYACMYHYGMTGAIVVGDGSGPAGGMHVGVGESLETMPVAQEQSETPQVAERSRVLSWAVAGIAGLILGAGLAGASRRRRDRA